jgi:glycolate oxidase FAD binding subunit
MGRLDSHWLLLVGFDGNHEAVKWQIDQLARELAASDAAIMDTIIGPAARHFWATLCNEPMQGGQQLSLYATIRSSATARCCQDVALLDPECAIHAHAGNGIVRMNFGEQWTEGTARVLMNKLLQSCGEHGNVVVRRCPTTWKPQLPIWGKVRGDLAMMHAVHKALDPNGRFNPGRLLKGI